MSTDNLFQNNNPATQETQANNGAAPVASVQNTPSFEDLLGMITNEQGEKKYKDVPTALHGLQASQQFISTLKSENATLKQQVEQLNAQVAKINELEETIRTLTASPTNSSAPTVQKVVDEQSVAELVNRTLSQREMEVIQKTNINTVISAVQQKFGAESEKVFYSKATELGMSAQEMNSLAARSPQAVLNLLGIVSVERKNEPFTAPTKPSVSTSGYQPQPETYAKPSKGILLGATSQDLMVENQNSKKLVEELHSKGLTTYDLTDPKKYFEIFGG